MKTMYSRLLGVAAFTVCAATAVSSVLGLSPGAALAATPKLAWGAPYAVDAHSESVNGLTQVSCTSTSFCAAVDGSGRTLLFDGSTWSKPRSVDADPTGFTGLSCPTKDFCIATDTDGFAVTWNGSRWSAPRQIDPNSVEGQLQLWVSCTSPSFCAAVDDLGYALTWTGKGWKRHAVTDQYGNNVSLTGVDCVEAAFCVAVDNSGDVVTWDGKAWSKPRAVDDLGGFTAVSCTSTKFCAAVGDGVTTYNGTKWSPPESISEVYMESVSCTSPSHCVAGDDLGYVYGWNGQRWSSATAVSPDAGLSSMSCIGTTFCVAVDTNGDAVFYDTVPAITTSSLSAATKGEKYSDQLRADGHAPYSWRVLGGLPPGLKVSKSGLITGAPSRAGKFSVKLKVTDVLHISSEKSLSLTVKS